LGVRAALLSERQNRTSSPHRDIVRWLETVSIEPLPWEEYSCSERAA
jgi:hypothetical protein